MDLHYRMITHCSCELRMKEQKAQTEVKGYYSNSGGMTIPSGLSVSAGCINR